MNGSNRFCGTRDRPTTKSVDNLYANVYVVSSWLVYEENFWGGLEVLSCGVLTPFSTIHFCKAQKN